jgi:all-trans-retinol 13,14-reductase
MDLNNPGGTCITLDYITDGKLKWNSMGDVYDVSVIGEDKVEWDVSLEKTVKNLLVHFPKDEEKIRNYIEVCKKIHAGTNYMFLTKILPNWLAPFVYWWFAGEYDKYRNKSCEEVMCNEMGMSKKLMFSLCYHFGDHGFLVTEKDSFILQCLVTNHYVKCGGFYPEGGSGQIAEKLIPVIESTGGKCLVKAMVNKILIKNNKAYGVKTSKGQEIYADIVISNAGIFNTFGPLVDEKISKQYNFEEYLKRFESGTSHFYVFVGFDKSSKELNIPKANYWIHNSYEYEKISDYRFSKDIDTIDWTRCGYFVSFSSSKDPLYEERYPNKSTCIVMSESNYDWIKEWNDKRVKQRGNVYEDFKKEVERETLKVLFKHFPHLEKHVKFVDVATPLTNEFYLNSYRGSSYGAKFSSKDVVKPSTPIENLYLTGQDVGTSGFSGAVGGAILTYGAINGEDISSTLQKKRQNK